MNANIFAGKKYIFCFNKINSFLQCIQLRRIKKTNQSLKHLLLGSFFSKLCEYLWAWNSKLLKCRLPTYFPLQNCKLAIVQDKIIRIEKVFYFGDIVNIKLPKFMYFMAIHLYL